MKPVVRLRATLQYCHAMLVFWLAVCSEQVAIQISICCLSKRFFILEYCELTAMASNITSVWKREKLISLWSSGYRNIEIRSRLHLSYQTVSNILSKFLQNGTAARGKPGWPERTHSRYSKCGGICGPEYLKDLELQSNQVKRTPQDSIYYLKNESVSRSRNWVVAKTKTPEN